MIEFKVGKCPKCGKLAEIIYSNNPLSTGLCANCLNAAIDPTNLKQADFFCRTYNLPFDPTKWIELHDKVGKNIFKAYTQYFYESGNDNLYYQPTTKDWWKELNEEWASCVTFEQILSKIEPIKKRFLDRCKIKWGDTYTFNDLVQLENLLITTLRANDINNPLQIDAIKKACKISVALDKAIENGDSKEIQELSKAYSSFTKTAQITDIIEAQNSDVISTVAELADYIEKCGGQYHYYDNVQRDIVDKTIADIQAYNRVLVQDATGLTTMLENIADNYKKNLEQDAAAEAQEKLSLEDIIKNQDEAITDFDTELEAETLDNIDIGGEDDDNF